MINLFLLIFFAVILSLVIKKDIEEVLPVFTAVLLVCLYLAAIAGQAHHTFLFSLISFVFIYVWYVASSRRILPSISEIRDNLLNINHIGFAVYIAVVIVMFYCYSNHFVNVWDDFHYNATFPRNMFYYGTMPYGFNSTTGYKDYFPTQQLFFYWGFQGERAFLEPRMFQYKIFLVYTFMLPLFQQMNSGNIIKRIGAGIVSIVLPFMCLFEILESLSMDSVLALLFANVVISVIMLASDEEKYRWFSYVRIGSFLFALVLYKSYALIFACIAISIWFVNEVKTGRKNGMIILIAETILTALAYLSWRLYCMTHGNTTYLSNILLENIKSGNGIVLPDYGVDTVNAILRSLVTLRLNFGKLGFTAFSGIAVYVTVSIVIWIYEKYSVRDLLTDLTLIAGFAGFVLFLMYTYLFIFEDWEASSLSSLDRYLGTYVSVLIMISAYRIFTKGEEIKFTEIVFTVVCIASLNYSYLSGALIPEKYIENRWDIYNQREMVKNEIENIDGLIRDTSGIIIVAPETDTLYMRAMQYELIPMHAYQYNVVENIMDMSTGLKDRIEDREARYVYFTEKLSEVDGWGEMTILSKGEEIEPGTLYIYDKETGYITRY